MSEQVLDVKESVRFLRRFWRTLAVFVLVGVAAAIGYEWWTLPRYVATSLVLLPASSSAASTSSSPRSVTTEGRIATSAVVLMPAGNAVDRSLTLSDLQSRVTTADVATSVLKISATGSTSHQAEALANAVSAQLVTFVATSGSSANSDVVGALHAESTQLNGQLKDVQKELSAANQRLSADGSTAVADRLESDLVGKLTSQEASLGLEIGSVKSQLSQAVLAGIAANQGTEVIQRATTATPPSKAALALPVALGAISGLLVGSVAILGRHRRDPRLRTRDALAHALGAPVVASLDVRPPQSTGDWQELLGTYQPSPLERWTTRRALRELGVGDHEAGELVVLCFAGDLAAIAQAVHVAVSCAASGTPTAFTVVAGEGSATALRAVCARLQEEGREARPGLEVGAGAPIGRTTGAEVAVTALVLEKGSGVEPWPRSASIVLSVSSGFASAEQLAAAAITAADKAQPVKGVLVANPTSADRTVGRYPEAGARTAPLRTRRLGSPRPEPVGGRRRRTAQEALEARGTYR